MSAVIGRSARSWSSFRAATCDARDIEDAGGEISDLEERLLEVACVVFEFLVSFRE